MGRMTMTFKLPYAQRNDALNKRRNSKTNLSTVPRYAQPGDIEIGHGGNGKSSFLKSRAVWYNAAEDAAPGPWPGRRSGPVVKESRMESEATAGTEQPVDGRVAGSRWVPVVMIAVSLLVAFVLGEALLRIIGYEVPFLNALRSFHTSDPVLGVRGRPSFEGRFHKPGQWDIRVVHDEKGFRRQEYAADPATCTRRIAVFGDSYVWGYGVDQGECFTDQMSLLMPECCIQNYGISATGTAVHLTVFETEVMDELQEGDAVVLTFYSNDFRDNIGVGFGGGGRQVYGVIEGDRVVRMPPSRPLMNPVKDFMKEWSYIYNIVSFVWDRRKATAPEAHAREAPPERGGASVIVTEYFLAEFKRQCDERGLRFLFVYIGDPADYCDYPGRGDADRKLAETYRAFVNEYMASLNIEYLDLRPYYEKALAESPGQRLTLIQDCHWTADLHQRIAEALSAYLD